MMNLQFQDFDFQDKSYPSFEIKVLTSGQFTTKIFPSGVIVKFPSYSSDVKCYEEIANGKHIHIIKGHNAEISTTDKNDILVIIGDNNFIYHPGDKHNVIVKGTANYVYDPSKNLSLVKSPVPSESRKSYINLKRKQATKKKSNILNLLGLNNIWNPLSVYFES